MKKILFMMQSLYNGGAERSLVNLLNELPADKYEIDLLLFKNEGMFLEQLPTNVNIVKTPTALKALFAPLKNSGIYSIVKIIGTFAARIFEKHGAERAAFRWKNFYSKVIPTLEKNYDVAVSYISGEVLYYVDEKVCANKKIVWIHNDYRTAGHAKKYDFPYLKHMDAIVSISEQCVEILREEFKEFSNKLYNIPNITSSTVVKNRAKEFIPIEYQGINNIILSIGRLSYQKGFDIAIPAAAELKKKGLDFKWFVIGTGDDKEILEKLIVEYDVSECFELVGARSNPYPYIAGASIFVQPSRYEGKSVVLDEAKILAKPIIATNYPTVYDQIMDGVEGIISEMTSEKIAQTIYNALSDKPMLDKVTNYLKNNDYGNADEVIKYMNLLDME